MKRYSSSVIRDGFLCWLFLSALLVYAVISIPMQKELWIAIEQDNHLLVRDIIKENPKIVNEKDSNDESALACAARFNRLKIAELFLSHGASVDAKDKSLRTPLHQAAAHGHLNMVELLVKNGADINAKTSEGMTPTRLAASNGHTKVFGWLKKKEGGNFRKD